MLMNKRQAKKLKKKNFIKHYKIYNEINNEIIKEIERLFPPGMMKRLAFIQNYAMWGPFKTIEDIKNVSGIGESTYANIKENITV